MLSLDCFLLSLLLLSVLRGVSCQQLTAAKYEESGVEGSTLTLTYSYSNTITASDDFFWYRQYPGKPPEFLLYISGLNQSRAADSLKSDTRFSTKLSGEKHLDLQMSSAAVTDSAVYYCAVRPTVTGNSVCHCDAALLVESHDVSCEGLHPVNNEQYSVVGSTVSLTYNYPELSTGDYFFWYRQNPGEPPQILTSHSSSGSGGNDPESRLKAKVQQKQIQLIISQLSVLRGVSCQQLTAVQTQQSTLEGSTVTLSCTFSKGSADYFFWYRQYPGKPPELLISHVKSGDIVAAPVPGLTVKVNETQMDLQMSSAAVTDSAVYYCAGCI
ncbi:uncharacterized protein LOC114449790 [Parambassis ranga]|uniref:Uncharacterized protein LOC114449790 n=1 Tax=Parambassis ranga TaxID=210632 RepID=A0A6P7K2H6_9TELE|nr:uncharacterized protein LOC114449790 [Parambassis ranga]